MPFRRCRPLWRALLISLVIHALLLVGAVRLVAPLPESSSSTLQVMVGSSPRFTAPASPAAASDRPRQRPAAPPVAPAETRRAIAQPLVQAVPSPFVSPPPAGSPAAPLEPAGEAPVSKPVAAASAGAGGARGDRAAGSTSTGASADDVRQYRVSLASAARRFKRYPPLARERGWEGSADVSITLHARLPVPEVALTRSSGHRLLDDQAVDMVTQAVRSTELPEGLRGRDLRLVLPVRFSLEGDQ